jgi:hypothetical protein
MFWQGFFWGSMLWIAVDSLAVVWLAWGAACAAETDVRYGRRCRVEAMSRESAP